MNIFAISDSPIECAQMLDDRRLVKMVLETAQLLCTAARINDYVVPELKPLLYKSTHINHPCSIWARAKPWLRKSQWGPALYHITDRLMSLSKSFEQTKPIEMESGLFRFSSGTKDYTMELFFLFALLAGGGIAGYGIYKHATKKPVINPEPPPKTPNLSSHPKFDPFHNVHSNYAAPVVIPSYGRSAWTEPKRKPEEERRTRYTSDSGLSEVASFAAGMALSSLLNSGNRGGGGDSSPSYDSGGGDFSGGGSSSSWSDD